MASIQLHTTRPHGLAIDRKRSIRTLAALLAGCLFSACASPPPEEPEPFAGNEFEDAERGIRARLPTGWVFASQDLANRAHNEGAKLMEERNPKLALQSAQAASRTQVMFMMANVVGSSAGRESIVLGVETLPKDVVGLTAATYSASLTSQLESAGYSIQSDGIPPVVPIDGRDFQSSHLHAVFNSQSICQSYYIHLQGKEALIFVTTHHDHERSRDLLAILRSVELGR